MTTVLAIPPAGPVETHELPADPGDHLGALQGLVGGYIEALPIPDFIKGAPGATAYVNEEGKFMFPAPEGVNWRATDFMVPGVGLFWGDYIAGPFVLAGFDPVTGEHVALPDGIEGRVRLIEQEAGGVELKLSPGG